MAPRMVWPSGTRPPSKTGFNIANEVIDEAKRGNWEMAKETILNECSPAMNELADIAQEIDAVTTQERSLEEESTLVMLRCI